MTATILDGKALAATMRSELDNAIEQFKAKHGITPTIAVVRAGDDLASVRYANTIEKAATNRGMEFALHTLPDTATQDEIVALVARLNGDRAIHGIMIQEPLPKGIDEAAVKTELSPNKDVDGVHPVNAGRLAQVAPAGRPPMVGPFFVPATPAGGLEILAIRSRATGQAGSGARPIQHRRQADGYAAPAPECYGHRLPLAHNGPGRCVSHCRHSVRRCRTRQDGQR